MGREFSEFKFCSEIQPPSDEELMLLINRITDRVNLQVWHGEFIKDNFVLFRDDLIRIYRLVEQKLKGETSTLLREQEFRRFKDKIVREKRKQRGHRDLFPSVS